MRPETSLPIVFPLGFVAFWLLMCWVVSLSGWRQLARYFPAGNYPRAVFHQSFWLQSATLRRPDAVLSGSRYGGVLRIQYGPEGLRLSVLPTFRFGHPPLLIPWSAIGVPQERRGTWGWEPTTLLP
ncbi:hypothetical protein [Hymenobacter cellulosilyticus]|uniref:Uncharacterized protein n=1 Tax=Hymenobacter cellulosilyticus TaxID=2932248 RepID=A0A8T9Q909_9BACT|nr:hypothetical protein [Hymenobacter cellulosilyticus]UOQ72009.1 hypothetical protein MUN79_26060 [Hymenobacter cellulosilyticus]